MSDAALLTWLVRSAIGGGLLLLLGWLWQRRLAAPARQQRLGEWTVAAALVVAAAGLAPAWLLVPVPTIRPVAAPAVVGDVPTVSDLTALEVWEDFPDAPDAPAAVAPVVPAPAPSAAEPLPPAGPSWWEGWRPEVVLLAAYAAVATVLLFRWLLANLAVWWLLRRRRPVPPALAELFAEMAWPHRCRLVVSDRVEVPFSVGLIRRTVVLPESLIEQATTEELRWVLAHELTHVVRQDTRTSWLFALGQVFYFYLPWFWWLRRQVRLSQEFIADAAAIEWAGSPADYAQFLVSWAGRGGGAAGRSPRVPAGATGVSGSGSDLFRRVTMLLEEKTPCERRCPRRWVTVVASALVAAGLVAGGLGLRTVAAEEKTPDPEQKVEPKKDSEKKTEPKKKDRPRRGLGLFAPGQGLDELFDQLGPMLDDEAMKELRQQMQEARRQLEQLRRQAGPNAALPLFPDAPWAVPGLRAARQHPPRLGVQVRPPSQTLVDQLDLPKDQGVVLEEVGPNSPAGKAGLKSHDILLELAGKTVPSKVEEFARMVAGIEANKPVDAVVLRKGKKETIQGLKLPEVKAEAAPPRPVVPGLANRFLRGVPGGARGMTSITRNNDEFTTKHRAGDVTITIKGKVEQGKAQVSEVVIDADGQKSTYDSVDKVPAAHREKVRKLAEMSARGTARFPLD